MGRTRGHRGTAAGVSPDRTPASGQPGPAGGAGLSGAPRGLGLAGVWVASLSQFWRAEDRTSREHAPKVGTLASREGAETTAPGRLALLRPSFCTLSEIPASAASL